MKDERKHHRNCGLCGKHRTATLHQLAKLGWSKDRCPKHQPKARKGIR